jgi:hypothetical protein
MEWTSKVSINRQPSTKLNHTVVKDSSSVETEKNVVVYVVVYGID